MVVHEFGRPNWQRIGGFERHGVLSEQPSTDAVFAVTERGDGSHTSLRAVYLESSRPPMEFCARLLVAKLNMASREHRRARLEQKLSLRLSADVLLHFRYRPSLYCRAALVCLALGLGFLGPSQSLAAGPALKRFEYALPRMGTIFRITLYSAESAQASQAADAAFARAEELEEIMSDYRADSELMHLSREGSAGPFPVSRDLYDVLAKSLWVSGLSDGLFDVTSGPLVKLWREARKTGQLPDAAAIANAKALVDYRNIELDSTHHTVFLKRAGMMLDLGAIGKGYAADQMLAVLRSHGIKHAMVVAGGEVAVAEAPPGGLGWEVGIETADENAGTKPCTLLLRASAVSTSGDEHQFLEINGRRYSHVINPVTGWALEGRSSTTVIARDSTTADALATAFSVMPVAKGIRVAESLPGVAALWVREVNGQWKRDMSRGFPNNCGERGN